MKGSSVRSQARLVALVVVLMALALAGAGYLGRSALAQTPEKTAAVSLVVPAQAGAGRLIAVKLVAARVANLAGFQATVSYDPARLRLTGARIEKGLARGGRDVLPLGPVLREGSVVLGAATCPVAACNDPRPATAKRALEGIAGTVELAVFEFYSEQTGRYELRLDGVILVDPQGARLPAKAAGAVLEVTAP